MSAQVILLRSSGAFRGPFTHAEAAMPGESTVALSEGQYSDLSSLRATNQGATIIFVGSSFRIATIDESAAVADTLQKALIALFGKIPSVEQAGRFLRLYGALTTLFMVHGGNGGALKPIMRAAIESTDVSGDEELMAIKADMLALSQWNL